MQDLLIRNQINVALAICLWLSALHVHDLRTNLFIRAQYFPTFFSQELQLVSVLPFPCSNFRQKCSVNVVLDLAFDPKLPPSRKVGPQKSHDAACWVNISAKIGIAAKRMRRQKIFIRLKEDSGQVGTAKIEKTAWEAVKEGLFSEAHQSLMRLT